jgi:YebC/PmpR family DNA-binding regulatory protein
MGAQWKAKHKDLAANAKGRLFGKLAKDIMIAARHGADPAANARLRLVMEQARKVSMPKDTLDRAIKKGAGLTGEAVHFEHVIYEGFAPHRVPVMVECLTDNVNRAASDMRVLFRKGQLGTSGTVSWDFDHVGIIEAEAAAKGNAAAKASEFVVYKDAPHAFHADYRPSYRKEAAEDGFKRALAWFKAHGVA